MLGISMRRMQWRYPGGSCEIRDGLDAAWWRFLGVAVPGSDYLPLPNIGTDISVILKSGIFSGFVLSGGDDWGVFPERDATEEAIFNYARSQKRPILGVCRGAQVINRLLGGSLVAVAGHAGTRHEVSSESNHLRTVNSYHNFGISQLAKGLLPLAKDDAGHTESFQSQDGLVAGIMWHPEREPVGDALDIELFAAMFGRTIT